MDKQLTVNKNGAIPIKGIYVLLAFWYVYILLTNFGNMYINSAFIGVVLIYTLLGKPANTIAIFPFLLVYYSYSYVGFDNLLGISTSQFIVLYSIAFSFRTLNELPAVIKSDRSILKFLLLTVLPLLCILQGDIVSAVKVLFSVYFSLYLAHMAKKDVKLLDTFIKVLLFSLLSTYVYNLIYIQIFDLAAEIKHLVGMRYIGVRDANDFSLYSNICIFLLYQTNALMSEKKKRVAIVLLSIGVLLSISMSGIGTLLVILAYQLFKGEDEQHRRLRKKTGILLTRIGVIAVVVVLLGILEILINPNSIVMTVMERIDTVFMQLAEGEYADATSSRTILWERYSSAFQEQSFFDKLIGNYSLYGEMVKKALASHNTYIDLLIVYGYMGAIVLLSYIAVSFFRRKNEQEKRLLLLQGLFCVNIFFRSFDVQSGVLFAFLLI